MQKYKSFDEFNKSRIQWIFHSTNGEYRKKGDLMHRFFDQSLNWRIYIWQIFIASGRLLPLLEQTDFENLVWWLHDLKFEDSISKIKFWEKIVYFILGSASLSESESSSMKNLLVFLPPWRFFAFCSFLTDPANYFKFCNQFISFVKKCVKVTSKTFSKSLT